MPESNTALSVNILDFLKLDKPIIFFDLETTGTKANVDKIVEISAIKYLPEGKDEFKVKRLNPEMPIPEEATNIHGIKDEDVKDCPTFKQIARSLFEFFGDCHLGGFGITHFDIRLLQNEFKRVGLDFTLEGRAVIDAKSIYHNNEPRDLTAALKFYCNKEMENAHNAKADVGAAVEILTGQFEKYKDQMPNDIYKLSDYCNPKEPDFVDHDGKFKWFKDEIIFDFGKHSGKTLKEVVEIDRDYLQWILQGNFSKEIKDLVSGAIEGKYPILKFSH